LPHRISHVNAQAILQYDSPHQFEPLMPSEAALAPLLEAASDLTRKATALGTASGKAAQSELRKLLRSMNSYYTNRIEGEHTRPSDIERALQRLSVGRGGPRDLAALRDGLDLGEALAGTRTFRDVVSRSEAAGIDVVAGRSGSARLADARGEELELIRRGLVAIGQFYDHVVVDLGAGVTKIGIFREGALIHADTIPIGGAHITNDLARILATTIEAAERLKTTRGGVYVGPADDDEMVPVPGLGESWNEGAGRMPLSLLIGIIQTFAVGIDSSLLGAAGMAGLHITPDTFGYPLWKLKISQIAPILPYLFLVLMLIFRPRGLLGTREG